MLRLSFLTGSSSSPWLSPVFIAALVFCPILILIVLSTVRRRKGLRNVPGPFLASILPFDRILTTFSGHQFQRHLAYHEKYGPLVRIGPKHVSVADSDQISVIYPITSKFGKVGRHEIIWQTGPLKMQFWY
jgi:hypothetical protein